MKAFLYAISIITLFATCTTPLRLPEDISAEKKILLPFKIETIHLADLRTDTVTADMKLPVFTTRQREWKIRPALTADLQNDIIGMIKQSSNPEGLPANVTFYIKDGYYKISGNAMNVGEHTFFECTIKFDLKEPERHWNSSAQALYDYVGRFNATEKNVKEMYRITVKNSVYKALKQGESVFEEPGDSNN